MDTEIRGLTDRFVARHTVDPALSNQWPFNRPRSTRNSPTEILLEVKQYTCHLLPSRDEEKEAHDAVNCR